jgi:uncharacterized HAD superfamily protein
MTITFSNDHDVIIYSLEKIISYTRENLYIFMARCIWWIATAIRLQQGLIIHIDNLMERPTIGLQGTTETHSSPEENTLDPSDRTSDIHPD